jgi:hypothetical protein
MTTPPPINPNVVRRFGESVRGPKNPLFALLGLGAVFVAGSMVADTYRGQTYEMRRLNTATKERTDYANMAYGWGHFSGNPSMDKFAHKVYSLVLYGPLNLREKYEDAALNVKLLFNNVFLPNLVPIGIAIGSMYLGFGSRVMHAPFKAGWRFIKSSGNIIPPAFRRKMGAFLAQCGNNFCTGVGKLLAMPFKSLHAFGFTAVALGLGAFFVNRFNDSYGHGGTEQFFRNQVYAREDGVEE